MDIISYAISSLISYNKPRMHLDIISYGISLPWKVDNGRHETHCVGLYSRNVLSMGSKTASS